MLRKAAGVERGSATTGRQTVGRVTRAQLLEIAEVKKADLNANDAAMAARIIEGTARSMGIDIVD